MLGVCVVVRLSLSSTNSSASAMVAKQKHTEMTVNGASGVCWSQKQNKPANLWQQRSTNNNIRNARLWGFSMHIRSLSAVVVAAAAHLQQPSNNCPATTRTPATWMAYSKCEWWRWWLNIVVVCVNECLLYYFSYSPHTTSRNTTATSNANVINSTSTELLCCRYFPHS